MTTFLPNTCSSKCSFLQHPSGRKPSAASDEYLHRILGHWRTNKLLNKTKCNQFFLTSKNLKITQKVYTKHSSYAFTGEMIIDTHMAYIAFKIWKHIAKIKTQLIYRLVVQHGNHCRLKKYFACFWHYLSFSFINAYFSKRP